MTPDPLARVQVRVRTRHGRRTVTLGCGHGRTVRAEPAVALAPDGAVALIAAGRDAHVRDCACDCIPRLADALDPGR